jgi:quinol-cytochrome oxidoreductase complex cytochrome b subunit
MLPAALAALIGIHVYLVMRHGESHFPKKDE